MARSIREHENTIPPFALATADALRGNAQQFIQQIPRKLNDAGPFIASNFGGMFAAATELTLAIELYLKALHGLIGRVPQTHELRVLFSMLPQPSQDSICDHFYRHIDAAGIEEDDTATLVIESDPLGTLPADHPQKMTVERLLERNNTAFIKWRYMHEIPESDAIRAEFDFLHLDVFCTWVRAAYVNQVNARTT